MSVKLTASAASVVIFGALSFPAFAATNDNNQQVINEKIDSLQQQINQLKKQVKQEKRKQRANKRPVAVAAAQEQCLGGQCGYNRQRISIGPYIRKDQLYDGSELLVNIPTIREDSRILLQQEQTYKEAAALGIPEPIYPRLVFSGKLEGLYTYASPYNGKGISNINFSGAELDTLVQASSFLTGYLALDYDPNEANDGSQIFMNRAFITIGNLMKSPFYGTIGQIYVPFGRYNSGMVSTPTTQALGRTRGRALQLGFQQSGSNAFHAELYAYQGLTSTVGSSNTNNQWGGDAGYSFKIGKVSGELGSSFISNLGDSQGLQSSVYLVLPPVTVPGGTTETRVEVQQHGVPAVDVQGSLAFQPFVMIAEYITALRQFNVNEVPYANQGAQPSALHTEIDYTFKTGSKPSSVGVGYDNTTQGVAIGLPQQSYEAFYNVNIFKATNFALEYRHDINYPTTTVTAASTSANPTPSSAVSNLGKSDNVYSAQFDLYF